MHDPATGAARWLVLLLLSIAWFGQIYVYDATAPVAEMLASQLGFSTTQVGMLNAVYSIPNIFLVLIGGLIIDRFGYTRVAVITACMCCLGAVLAAATGDFLTMTAGRFMFGAGAETMSVAVSVALGIWFARYGVAFAYAINLGVARAGSRVADLSPAWAGPVYRPRLAGAPVAGGRVWRILSVEYTGLCMGGQAQSTAGRVAPRCAGENPMAGSHAFQCLVLAHPRAVCPVLIIHRALSPILNPHRSGSPPMPHHPGTQLPGYLTISLNQQSCFSTGFGPAIIAA